MTIRAKPLSQHLLTLSVAALLAALPANHLTFGPDGIHLAGGQAYAKKGGDDDGGSDDSESDHGGDDSDDESGGGSRDSGDDSRSGRGGDDDSGNDDSAESRGHDRSDDSRGSERGDDHREGRGRNRNGQERAGRDRSPKVEVEGSHIEVRYSNGYKDEIENGIFERKDPSGRTVSRRRATEADRGRLAGSANRLSRSLSNERARSSRTVHVEFSGNNAEVRYSDGWKEEIENGRYELKDPKNNTVIQRRARQSDLTRLRALENR